MRFVNPGTGLAAVCILFLTSCAPAPRVVLDPDRVSPLELVENIRVNHLKKNTLHARGSISIETAEFANSGRFTMNLQHPDSLLIKLRGPFGIDVGTVFLSQTNFLFYNGLKNQVITGDPRTDILKSFLRMDVDARTVMDLFLGGNTYIFSERRTPDEFGVDGDQYLMVYRSGDRVRRYWIDPTLKVVTRSLISEIGGRPLIEERFDKFIEVRGIAMARTIRLVSHKDRASISVSYDRLDMNTEELSFDFTIPQSATIIGW